MTEPCLELKYCVPVKPKVLAVDPGTSVELLRFCASECDVQLTGGCSEPDTLAGLTYNTLEPTIAPDVGIDVYLAAGGSVFGWLPILRKVRSRWYRCHVKLMLEHFSRLTRFAAKICVPFYRSKLKMCTFSHHFANCR